MLCIAVYGCAWLAARKMSSKGGNPQLIWDQAFWFFIFGILGARLFYIIEYPDQFKRWVDFFAVWEGGLVVYGSALGGLVAFLVFTWKHRINRLWFADLIAPYMILGVAIGRIGCLLNGCCYGDYCEAPWAVTFPGGSGPHQRMVHLGLQTRLGFLVDPMTRQIAAVEPGSLAEQKGLRVGDQVTAINGQPTRTQGELRVGLLIAGVDPKDWDRVEEDSNISIMGKQDYTLAVSRPVAEGEPAQEIVLQLKPSRSLPIHPTQVYSSISNFLLFLLLLCYYPQRRHNGEVIALMAMGYAIYRFLVEFLRFDEAPLFDGLTISQNVSLLLFAGGIAVWVYSRRTPLQQTWADATSA